jgi:MoaA/NifB/PqqE/SkfB family radical SAM enzyme
VSRDPQIVPLDLLQGAQSTALAGGRIGRISPLRYVNLYLNTACNSQCITCSFWSQTPQYLLRPERVRTIVESRFADRGTWFAVQGGEFTLHPQCDLILEMLADRRYILFSNLLSFERVLKLVRKHKVRFLTVSLDGGREGYRRIRGVDAFDRVTRNIQRLRGLCTISVGFTLTPWSHYRDYEEVAEFCRNNDIDFGVNLYTQSHIYEAEAPLVEYSFLDRINADLGDQFCLAYKAWMQGQLKLPCQSIREVASIAPDGTVYLCHNQKISLGNINSADFDDIWAQPRTARLHAEYESCNACWTSCYRGFDLDRALEASTLAALCVAGTS